MTKKLSEIFPDSIQTVNQEIPLDTFSISDYSLFIKREDLLHHSVSGNKFRKLKYLFGDMIASSKLAILTFGGAYSNHISATAALGKLTGIPTIGMIRGDELGGINRANPTLQNAALCGMTLHYMSREDYRDKMNPDVLMKYTGPLDDYYIIPEGGTSELAVKGCQEILSENDYDFDYIAVSVGTGGTFAGILNSLETEQIGIGFSALKGKFQHKTLKKYTSSENFVLIDDYAFGGYAKIDSRLIRFMNDFREKSGILLDPVYTAKMMYGVLDLMKQGYFKKNSRILAIHTGGLQGIKGMNELLIRKKLPQILH